MSIKYGIKISPICKINYGLYIRQGIGVITNSATQIGKNCNLSQFLSIGTDKSTPEIITNNVYSGSNVCIVEDIHVMTQQLELFSVLMRDIPYNNTAVGPCKSY